MPGIATHIAIAKIIKEKLDINLEDESKIKNLIEENESFYKMGSLGPDMLFFAPDYGEGIHELLKQITDFYENIIEPIENFYETYIEPMTDFVDDVVGTIDETVFCGLFSEVGNQCDDTLNRISEIRNNLLFLYANENTNLFDMMQPAIQKGESEKEWYWFDMLHYRKTGSYAKKMWDNSSSDKQKAFVLGYISHIAADITGHPYVNTVVGGPARSHNQRHHFVENMIDSWVYDNMLNSRLTSSYIHRELPSGELFDTDESIFRTLFRNADEIPSKLDEIFEMMEISMKETFEDSIHPERLDSEYLRKKDLNFAYLAILASLKSMSSSHIGKPANPTDDMLDSINNAMNEFLEHASNPPTNSAGSLSFCVSFWRDDCNLSVDSFLNYLENVWENIAYLAELIAWVGQLLKDIWDLLSCTLTAAIKVVIKSLFWIIQSSLYTISQEIRQVLVLSALLPPEKEWLNKNPIGQACVSLKDRSPDDGLLYGKYYPHRAYSSNSEFLKYPKTSPESEVTAPGPYSYGSTPKDFIENVQENNNLYEEYSNAETPRKTRDIEQNTRFESIGSSIDVAKKLMKDLLTGQDIPNWNLDSDRGFAYKTWSVSSNNNPLAWNSNISVEDEYIN
jgi:hypothetical protein